MPFTLAHPAAVLPLRQLAGGRLRLAALVLGSTTPDYEYFLRLDTVGTFAHSLLGLFVFCLPAGWVSLWLFDRFGRRGVQALLPRGWHLPAPERIEHPFLSICAAILLGAMSHVVWDSFTHAGGWAVVHAPALASPAVGSIPWFKVLQHGSTALGVAVLAYSVVLWARTQPKARAHEILWRGFAVGAVLVAAAVLNGLRFRSDGLSHFVVAGGVAVSLAIGLGLVGLGLASTRREE